MSQEKIKELFDYRDGALYWKTLTSRKIKLGARAGTIKNDSGYEIVCVNRRLYRTHRLIWVMFNGDIPDGFVIDHIDRNRANNNLNNLRVVTISQNTRNAKRFSTNTTGVRGIYFDRGMKKYCARIYTVPYKCKILGYYDNLAEAKSVRLEAEKLYDYL